MPDSPMATLRSAVREWAEAATEWEATTQARINSLSTDTSELSAERYDVLEDGQWTAHTRLRQAEWRLRILAEAAEMTGKVCGGITEEQIDTLERVVLRCVYLANNDEWGEEEDTVEAASDALVTVRALRAALYRTET